MILFSVFHKKTQLKHANQKNSVPKSLFRTMKPLSLRRESLLERSQMSRRRAPLNFPGAVSDGDGPRLLPAVKVSLSGRRCPVGVRRRTFLAVSTRMVRLYMACMSFKSNVQGFHKKNTIKTLQPKKLRAKKHCLKHSNQKSFVPKTLFRTVEPLSVRLITQCFSKGTNGFQYRIQCCSKGNTGFNTELNAVVKESMVLTQNSVL